MGKRTLSFAKFSNLVLIRSILNKILNTLSNVSWYIFEFFFFNGCISFNIGPNNTKLEDFANLGFLVLTFVGPLLFIP